MVQFAGNYQTIETENPEVVIEVASNEVTDEKIAAVKSLGVEVQVNNDDYQMTSKLYGQAVHVTKFTLGKSFEEDGGKVTTTVVKDGNKLTFTSNEDGKIIKRVFEFSDTGLIMSVDPGAGKVGKITYKRV